VGLAYCSVSGEPGVREELVRLVPTILSY